MTRAPERITTSERFAYRPIIRESVLGGPFLSSILMAYI
jgi:hypothetical protein